MNLINIYLTSHSYIFVMRALKIDIRKNDIRKAVFMILLLEAMHFFPNPQGCCGIKQNASENFMQA